MNHLATQPAVTAFKAYCKSQDLYAPTTVTPLFVSCIGGDSASINRALIENSRILFCFNTYKVNPLSELVLYLSTVVGKNADEAIAISNCLPIVETAVLPWTNIMTNVRTRGLWKHALDELEKVRNATIHYNYKGKDGQKFIVSVNEAMKKTYCGSMAKTYPLGIRPLLVFRLIKATPDMTTVLDDKSKWSPEVKNHAKPMFIVEMQVKFMMFCPSFEDDTNADIEHLDEDTVMQKLFTNLVTFFAYIPFFDKAKLEAYPDHIIHDKAEPFTSVKWSEDYTTSCEALGASRVFGSKNHQSKIAKRVQKTKDWAALMEARSK
jgi:hypothetical protein